MSSSIIPDIKLSSLELKFIEAFPNEKFIHKLMVDVDAAWMKYMYAPPHDTKRRVQYEEIRDILFDQFTMEHLIFIEARCHPKSDFGMATSAKIAEKALLHE